MQGGVCATQIKTVFFFFNRKSKALYRFMTILYLTSLFDAKCNFAKLGEFH